MILSVIFAIVSINFIICFAKYEAAENEITRIVNKAERGHVYDLKNGYIEYWTSELTARHQKALDKKENVIRYSDFAKWINKNRTEKIFAVLIVATIVCYNGTIAEYACILAIAKKTTDWYEFQTNPKYYNQWNWKKKYQYVMDKAKKRKAKQEKLAWISKLN